MTVRKPYPWSDGDGVCGALDDPSLWSAVYRVPFQRQVFKRIFKRLALIPRHEQFSVANDAQFGRAVVEIFAFSGRRERAGRVLEDAFSRRPGISSHAFFGLRLAEDLGAYLSSSAGEYPVDQVCSPAGSLDMDPQRLAVWLSGRTLKEVDTRDVVRLVCAGAMTNRARAAALFEVLVQHGGLFSDYVVAARAGYGEVIQPSIEIVSTGGPVSGNVKEAERGEEEVERAGEKQRDEKEEGDEVTRQEAPGAPVDTPTADNPSAATELSSSTFASPAIVPLLQQWDRWDDIPIGSLRVGLDVLRNAVRSADERTSIVEDLVRRITRQLNEIGAMPWWEQPVAFSALARVSETETLGSAGTRLSVLEGQVSRVNNAHARLSTLAERLERRPEPVALESSLDLERMATALEQRADVFHGELERQTVLEARARGLVDRILALDPATRSEDALADTAVEDSINLAHQYLVGRSLVSVPGRFELAGALFALSWPSAPSKVADPLRTEVERRRGTAEEVQLLAYLDLAMLQQLASRAPEIRGQIAELLFVTALVADDSEALDYLDTILPGLEAHPACVSVYRAFCAAHRRGSLGSLRAHLHAAEGMGASVAATENEARQARERLLEMVRNPPGMTGNFHRLRLIARMEFLVPLEPSLASGNIEGAAAIWRGRGTVNDMVDWCVRASGRAGELDDVHHRQTAAFLGGFGRELERCRRLHLPPQRTELTEAILRLDEEIDRADDRSASLLRRIDLLRGDSPSALLPSQDFGRRTTQEQSGRLVLQEAHDFVRSNMLFCWPSVVAGDPVSLRALLIDRVRDAHGAGVALDMAVDVYLQSGALVAARRAALEDAGVAARVEEAIQHKITAFEQRHADVLVDARAGRKENGYLDLWLIEIEEALKAFDLAAADRLTKELEPLVAEHKRKTDPVRLSHLEFLREAGEEGLDELPVDALAERICTLRVLRRDRRLHILELETAAENEIFALSHRAAWSALSQQLDQPRSWPVEEVALGLSLDFQMFFKFMRGKLRHRNVDPDIVDVLVSRLGEWITEQGLLVVAAETSESALLRIHAMAQEIENAAPERHILHLLGVSATPAKPLVPTPSIVGAPSRNELQSMWGVSRAERRERTLPPPVDVVARVRQFLKRFAKAEQDVQAAEPRDLKDAILRRDWRSARGRAAALVLQRDVPTEPLLAAGEVVYALTLTLGSSIDDRTAKEAFTKACLGAILHDQDFGFYSMSRHVDVVLPRALVRITLGEEQAPPTDAPYDASRLMVALSKLSEMGPGDEAYDWTGDLLATASSVQARDGTPGAAQLAQKIWGALTGLKDNAAPRRNLLLLLYRLRRFEALRHLAQTARPVDDLIVQCVMVFERAEADPELRVPAMQIYSALCDQARGRQNTKPWTQMFGRIGPSVEEDSGPAISCSLEDAFAGEEIDGTVTLPIRLVPAPSVVVDGVQIHIGAEDVAHVETYDDVLVKDAVIYPRVPRACFGSGGEVTAVPYRIVGRTIRGAKIDLRGSWTLQTARVPVAQPIREGELRAGWPGASGEPVTAAEAFHGRQREIHEIERYVLADDRQRSVMLFGQRRIGKTSLLCQMVASMPPSEGRVAGAFLDVSGMALSKGSLAKSFFDHVVVALENDTRNASLRRKLEQFDVAIPHLARGLTPAVSLAYALEGLVDKMKRESRGSISRIALFIDEFDRFVEPLLANQREEVDQLMWQIRQIVQRSEAISLVLAGSGLQRLLVTEYVAPLFGSIDSVEIAPFDMERDRNAIEHTFIPPSLRSRICAKDAFCELAQEAYLLSGGHPYYLSMLGYSAALQAAGRPLTRAALNRTVEAMVNGTIRATGPRIDAARFYAPIFESLRRLSARLQAVAQLLLLQVAQRTTREYPWLSVADVGEGADLRGVDGAEIVQAQRALVDEDVLDVDGRTGTPRFRIRVPLTASALRQDATVLRQESKQKLQHPERGVGA